MQLNPMQYCLILFCLDEQGPAVTELIKGDTTAAATLPVEAAGDGPGLGTGVTGDRGTPCVPAGVAAGGMEDGEVKDGDTAGEAEVIGGGRGDAAMLEGVLDTDAVAGDWGDIGGRVGDETGLSVVVALGDAVTGVGDAVTGVGDAVTGVGDAATGVGAAATGEGDAAAGGCCDRGGGCSKGARGRGNWAGSSSAWRCPCGAGGCWSSSWQ